MAIVNSVKTLFPGFGNTTEYISVIGTTMTINGTVNIVFTGFTNYVRSGKIKLNFTAAPAASQVTGIKITGTDGTATVTLYQDATARTAAELIELLFEFLSEYNLTTVTLAVTMANAGTAPTADAELAGNP